MVLDSWNIIPAVDLMYYNNFFHLSVFSSLQVDKKKFCCPEHIIGVRVWSCFDATRSVDSKERIYIYIKKLVDLSSSTVA